MEFTTIHLLEMKIKQKEANFVTKLLNNKIPPLGVFLDLEDEKFQGDLTNKELTTVATTF